LTIWVKLFHGPNPPSDPELHVPIEGFFLEVLFEGFDRPNTNDEVASADQFSHRLPTDRILFPEFPRTKFNYKYEYLPSRDPNNPEHANETLKDLIGNGTWTIYIKDGAGNQLSDPVEFITAPNNPNREIYIAWVKNY